MSDTPSQNNRGLKYFYGNWVINWDELCFSLKLNARRRYNPKYIVGERYDNDDGEGVKERIDLVALALLLKAVIRDLASYDACYVPRASPVWEPVNIAASQAAKQL